MTTFNSFDRHGKPCTMTVPDDDTRAVLEVGDFISIPVWNAWGQVTSIGPDTSGLGSENAILITLQERPEGPERRYRLEPDSYVVL